jgi:hypothetical protein
MEVRIGKICRCAFGIFIACESALFFAMGLGGLIGWMLDLIYAILGYSPHRAVLIQQTIASGVFGIKRYQGGTASAARGIGLAFDNPLWLGGGLLSCQPKAEVLNSPRHSVRNAIQRGLFRMHLIVVPLSSAAPSGHLAYAIPAFVEHLFSVGLPFSLSARRYAP